MNNIPNDLLLNINTFLNKKDNNNFRVAYKYFALLVPVNFNIKNLLDGKKKLEKGDKNIHFTNKETCLKILPYVKKNYDFSHVCCNGLGIMIKDPKNNFYI